MTNARLNPSPKPKVTDEILNAALARLTEAAEQAKQFRRDLETWAAGQPQTVACSKHPHVIQRIDFDRSSARSWEHRQNGGDGFRLVYTDCPECVRDAATTKAKSWMHAAGVPSIIEAASFDTFVSENEQDRMALATARAFHEAGKGFLVMTGNPGDGKSFLAAAILRAFGRGVFRSHNDLLIQLRAGYGDPKAVDVLELCRDARLFVLDEIGLSTGGRDDLPMLHHILDHRHSEKLPTVITSNLTLENVKRTLGDRMAERFRQSLFRHVEFTGPSHRSRMRADYLQ